MRNKIVSTQELEESEKNSLLKYKNFQLQNIGRKIAITNKILNEKKKKASTYTYIGGNKKNISIIIKETSSSYVDDKTLEQINLILKSHKLETSEVAIFNIEKEKIQIDDLINNLLPKIILLFDIDNKEIALPISIDYNNIQAYKGSRILLAVSLEKLFQDNEMEAKERRVQLWRSLNNILGTYDAKKVKYVQEVLSILKKKI